MKNAPNGARLALSDVSLPAIESPRRSRAITRGARGYSAFLDMSASGGDCEKRVKRGETRAIQCTFTCNRKPQKVEGHNTGGPWIFCIFGYVSFGWEP